MSDPKPQAAPAQPRAAKSSAIYRGVRIQSTGGKGRFSVDQIRRAVAAAIEKNADALAGGT